MHFSVGKVKICIIVVNKKIIETLKLVNRISDYILEIEVLLHDKICVNKLE